MKRFFDVFFSMLLIFILFPLFGLIAIAVFLQDRGPVFFKQKRVGYKGKMFFMLKFRTMIVEAEQKGTYFTKDNDSRITKLGKVLRKSSLDELPQLLNVLIGDMSFVGPRPDVIQQKELYTDDEWRSRCSVRPGITGLAQATLRSQATIEERKSMDLQYVKNKSFLFDLKIILLTLKQIITKGGN